jgi:hypothetical protein
MLLSRLDMDTLALILVCMLFLVSYFTSSKPKDEE